MSAVAADSGVHIFYGKFLVDYGKFHGVGESDASPTEAISAKRKNHDDAEASDSYSILGGGAE
jgi:hypothetical protein